MENPEKGQKYNGLCARPRLSINIPSTKSTFAVAGGRPSHHDMAMALFHPHLDLAWGLRNLHGEWRLVFPRPRIAGSGHPHGHMGRAVDRLGVQRSARHQAFRAPPKHAHRTTAVLG